MLTMTGNVPTVARSQALSKIVTWLLATKDCGWGAPLRVTVEERMNPLPLIVSVNELVPTVTDDGDRLLTVGCGLGEAGNG